LRKYPIFSFVGVWNCGFSIVKYAFTEARQRPRGINLGLERLHAHIWWQGKSGMLASQLPRQIRIMLQFEDPPSYLVVHVGGNDFGKEKIGYLRNNLKLFLRTIQRKLPNTIIVWWQISFSLPPDMCVQPFEPKINSSGSLSSFGEGVFDNREPTVPYPYN
jgi:hypothetical protein